MGYDIPLNNVGDTLYIRAKDKNDDCAGIKITGTGKFACSGNIMSLLDASCQQDYVPLPDQTLYPGYGCFGGNGGSGPVLFDPSLHLVSAPKLPATVLSYRCYKWLFTEQSDLSAAPELPATTLAKNCYESMFCNCTSLTAAPDLPATQLADHCYACMFEGCTQFTECHMKESMNGVYDPSVHGDTDKTVVYDL